MINKLSISTKLSVTITAVALMVLSTVFGIFSYYSHSIVHEEAVSTTEAKLNLVVQSIDNVLVSVELAVKNVEWLVHRNLNTPDSLYELTRKILENNTNIVGSAIAFVPNYYPQRERLFSPFSFKKHDGSISSYQLANDNYNYLTMDWFCQPKIQAKSVWSEPYFYGSDGGQLMITYSKPLYNKGEFIGVFTADLSLDWLADMMQDEMPYPTSYGFLVSKRGTFMVHPNKDWVLKRTITEVANELQDNSRQEVSRRILLGESGYMKVMNDNQVVYTFYTPVKSAGWAASIICSHSDIFAKVDIIDWIATVVVICGAILLLLFSITIIRRMLSPLTIFTKAIENISKGDFASELKEITGDDEMGKLYRSFVRMQSSLQDYIAELKDTTITKERIESELRIASEIQMGMIPKTFPPFPTRDDIDLFATLHPAREIGGDLYDFYISDNKLYFVIGDVSGKGIPASLLMAVTRSLFRSVSAYLYQSKDIVSSINNTIAQNNETNMFVTLFIGILDLESGEMDYCNAGHDAPIILTDSDIHQMKVNTNIPVGVFEDFNFESEMITINPNSTLLLYTDGVTESENLTLELFSIKRLLSVLHKCISHSPRELIVNLVASVREHANGAEQNDDITLLSIVYKPEKRGNMKKEIILKNEISQISLLKTFIEEFGEELGFESSLIMNLNVVLEEAVTNIIFYAYPQKMGENIYINVEKRENILIFTIKDCGEYFDPTLIEDIEINFPVENLEIGGLGIFLIKQIMNEVEYQRIDGNNVFTLKKDITVFKE